MNRLLSYLTIEVIKLFRLKYLVFAIGSFILIAVLILAQFKQSFLGAFQAYQLNSHELDLKTYFFIKLSHKIHLILFLFLLIVSALAIEVDDRSKFITKTIYVTPVILSLYLLCKTFVCAFTTVIASMILYLFIPYFIKSCGISAQLNQPLINQSSIMFSGISQSVFYVPLILLFFLFSTVFNFRLALSSVLFLFFFFISNTISIPNPLSAFRAFDFVNHPIASVGDFLISLISGLSLLWLNTTFLNRKYG